MFIFNLKIKKVQMTGLLPHFLQYKDLNISFKSDFKHNFKIDKMAKAKTVLYTLSAVIYLYF